MRKPFLLLPLLLAPGLAVAHVSDAAYCANARGVPNWPYRCFSSLEGAEAWIRQDDGASDGYSLLAQAPARAGGHPTAWELTYAVPNGVAAPRNNVLGQGALKSLAKSSQSGPLYGAMSDFYPRTWIGCGGGYTGSQQGCDSEGAVVEEIQQWYLRTYGERINPSFWGGYREAAPDQIAGQGVENSTPPKPMFWVGMGDNRGLNPNGWTGAWGLTRWQWFECGALYANASNIDGFGIRQPFPNWCAASVTSNISLLKSRQGDPSCENEAFGNPCIPATGNKVQSDVDFTWNGTGFTRHYSSIRDFPAQAGMGPNWSHTYTGQLLFSSSGLIWYLNEKHLIERFRPNPEGGYDHYASENVSGLVLRADYSTPTRTWVLVKGNERRRFDNWGRLIAIESDQPAHDLQLEYCPATATSTCGVPYALHKVRTAQGRELVFDYADDTAVGSPDHAAGRYGKLIEVRADGQPLVRYGYDSLGRLIEVDHTVADAAAGKRRYHYGESDHLCRTAAGSPTAECPSHSFPFHLTGITDETGVRYAHFTFDDAGRATSTSHAGGVDRYTFAYIGGETIVTHPSGKVETLIYNGMPFAKLDQRTAPEGVSMHSYDGFGRRTASVDKRGMRTEYGYDSGHREIVRIEAKGTPQQRRLEIEWNSLFNTVTERRTRDANGVLLARQTSTYNSRGQVVTRSVIDPHAGAARTKAYAYCEAVTSDCPLIGLLKTIDGPRTDVVDVTSYAYYSADAAGCATTQGTCAYRRGDLRAITNALGLTTEMLAYDSAGRVLAQRDPNGVRSEFVYDARGRLQQRIVRGSDDGSETDDAITRTTYLPNGQIARVTQPDGAYIAYTYDAAQRLTAVSDGLGNTISYALDTAGNRVQEAARDPNGQLHRQLSRVYDTLNQLQTVADANAVPVADYTYDANGAIDTMTDALGRVQDQDVDALGRLIQSTANKHGSGSERAMTGYAYDALGRLRTVTDPNGLTTTYGFDGLGNQTSLQSPDTGRTTYTYDSAGNRTTQTDARGITLTYAYDAASRVTSVKQPTEPTVTFAYDQVDALCATGETYAAGRLNRMADAAGESRYCYDRDGNLVRRQHTLTDGPTLTVRASHSIANQLATLTYPSGATVRYARNTQGQIIGVYAKPASNAPEVVIADAISYLPFGPLQSWRYGNGRLLTKTYDRNYAIDRIADNAASGFALDFTTDTAGNIVGLSEQQGSTTAARTIAYDGQNRLAALRDGVATMQAFTYDATGNRTSKSESSTTTAYGYASDSHRLTSVGADVRRYDAAGNTTSIARSTPMSLSYDERGRLREVSEASAAKMRYRYNGRGERVAKLHPTDPNYNRWFVYADDGRLLGEYDNRGARIAEYVWLENALIAVLSDHAGSSYQFVETDHLGTPRAIVHPTRNVIIWRWDLSMTAFGEHAAQEDPDADGMSYTFNLRYPGQYSDRESGLSYNYFRDYDPTIGRYIESDPIGLNGDLNTFAYSENDPVRYFDARGLKVYRCTFGKWDHAAVCVDGNCAGKYPGYKGARSYWDLAFGDDSGYIARDEFEAENCREVGVPGCCSQSAFESCVARFVSMVGSKSKYSFFWDNCIAWVDMVLTTCTREACG